MTTIWILLTTAWFLLKTAWILLTTAWILLTTAWLLMTTVWILLRTDWILLTTVWILWTTAWILLTTGWILLTTAWILLKTAEYYWQLSVSGIANQMLSKNKGERDVKYFARNYTVIPLGNQTRYFTQFFNCLLRGNILHVFQHVIWKWLSIYRSACPIHIGTLKCCDGSRV